MAYLRPGTRPTGAENAMIMSRLLSYLRRHWPQTHILVRGDSHFATPEVIEVIAHRRLTDFVLDRKSTRLNSSHGYISYAVFCLKKKKKTQLHSKFSIQI